MLGLRLMDESHTGLHIAERISNVVDEHGLTDKIFTITLDNASSNNTAMSYLKPVLCGYLGIVLPPSSNTNEDNDLSSIFLH